MRKSENEKLKPLSERQRLLMEVVQQLDPAKRHTLTIECRGTEPWRVDKIIEHQPIELKPEKM